ncbi:Uncharacterised protein [Yersinia similis]|uniref:hypothetical protein n=1 Tax=Yersinia similis TaxID=367190 RepID=UPI0005E581B6|nr:hypothetical protein [Yersinia similis]CNE41225.1 Uncharacterised protein [Yersinia similis]
MSNVTFVYDQDSGLSAGLSGFINESGAYVFTISEAKYVISSGGAKSVEFSVETDDGRKANYLNVYTVKKDGSSNTHGVNMINAMMGCAGVKQLTMIKNEAGIDVAPEFGVMAQSSTSQFLKAGLRQLTLLYLGNSGMCAM